MFFYLAQFTWGILQNLLGFIIFVFAAATGRYKRRVGRAFVCQVPFNVSLGCFIFVVDSYDELLIKHEYGHTLQSLILGPFYLLIIGLPSLIWAGFFDEWRRKRGISYYSFYTERLANSLVGIKDKK